MISFPLSDVRIFLCATPIKMQCSFDTLMGLAQTVFDQDPLSGHLFLFFNRERNRVKILFWDQDGFCIWYKRLEAGTFQFPEADRDEALSPRRLKRKLTKAAFLVRMRRYNSR
jgi:transposase